MIGRGDGGEGDVGEMQVGLQEQLAGAHEGHGLE